MASSRNFTPKEVAWIVSLPLRRFRMGSTVKQGYFDESTGRIFMVNENGELTGETATPKAPAGEQRTGAENGEGVEPPVSDDGAVDSEADNGKKKKKGKKEKPAKKPKHQAADSNGPDDEAKKKNNKLVNIIGAILGVLVLALVILLYIGFGGGGQSKQPAPSPEPTAVITPTPAPTPTPTPPGMMDVPVVQAVSDILKGQQISNTSVEQVTITMQEYNQLVAMGATPCKWDELSTIEGMYANSFIAAGSYVSNYYLTVADPIPANPWRDYASGYQTFTLNMSAMAGVEKPFFGAQTVLKVTKSIDIYAEGAEVAPDLSWPEGSEEPNPYACMTMDETAVSDTVVQRVFTITDAIVCDLLDAEGNSLFKSYIPYVDMPTVNRLGALTSIAANPDMMAAMTPVSVVLRLTDAEATALGSLASATAVVEVNGNADASSDLKYSITWGTQSIIQSLFPVEVSETPADVAADAAAAPGSGIVMDVVETPVPEIVSNEGDAAAVAG